MKVTDNKKHNELTCVRCRNIIRARGCSSDILQCKEFSFRSPFEALFVYGATRAVRCLPYIAHAHAGNHRACAQAAGGIRHSWLLRLRQVSVKGDVYIGMSLHEKERNKKMPTPRHKVTHNPIPTSLFCFNILFVCLL